MRRALHFNEARLLDVRTFAGGKAIGAAPSAQCDGALDRGHQLDVVSPSFLPSMQPGVPVEIERDTCLNISTKVTHPPKAVRQFRPILSTAFPSLLFPYLLVRPPTGRHALAISLCQMEAAAQALPCLALLCFQFSKWFLRFPLQDRM